MECCDEGLRAPVLSVPRQRNKVRCEADRRAQRVVVLQLLREDHEDLWARSELEAELGDVGAQVIACALASLQEAGVVELEGDSLSASRAAWRLQELLLLAPSATHHTRVTLVQPMQPRRVLVVEPQGALLVRP